MCPTSSRSRDRENEASQAALAAMGTRVEAASSPAERSERPRDRRSLTSPRMAKTAPWKVASVPPPSRLHSVQHGRSRARGAREDRPTSAAWATAPTASPAAAAAAPVVAPGPQVPLSSGEPVLAAGLLPSARTKVREKPLPLSRAVLPHDHHFRFLHPAPLSLGRYSS